MLSKGTVVKGVWHKQTYRIYHELGRGAIGIVYIVENLHNTKLYAMKVATSMQSIAAEYKMLEKIQRQVQSKYFGPLLFEMDDIRVGEQNLYFYTMEYIKGKNLFDENRHISKRQYLESIRQIADTIHELHLQKLVFCDLKPENILMEADTRQIRFVDFGGVVPEGRMIKQYSVLYDRGSWKMGSRKADRQYDMFALGILLVQCFTKKKALHTAQKNQLPMYALYDIIHRELHPRLKQICIKIFSEKYQSASQISEELQQVITKRKWEKPQSRNWTSPFTAIDNVFWFSLACMVGSIYVALDVLR